MYQQTGGIHVGKVSRPARPVTSTETDEERRARFAEDPGVAAWLAKVAADRPPLTAAQIAILRPICQQMLPHMRGAAERRDPDGGDTAEPPSGSR